MGKRPSTAIVDVGLRMREQLRAQLEKAAKASGASMNHEIVRRLELSFHRQELLQDVLTLAFGKSVAPLLLAVANNEHSLMKEVQARVWKLQREGHEFAADLPPPPPTDEEFDEMIKRHGELVKAGARTRGK